MFGITDVCPEFIDILTRCIKDGYDFEMRGHKLDGNVAFRISNNETDCAVDIAEYLSPIGKRGEDWEYSAIGLSIEFAFPSGNEVYLDGSDVDTLYRLVQLHLAGKIDENLKEI